VDDNRRDDEADIRQKSLRELHDMLQRLDPERQPHEYDHVKSRYTQLAAMQNEVRDMIGEKPRAYPTALSALGLIAGVIAVQFGVHALLSAAADTFHAAWLDTTAVIVAIANASAFTLVLLFGVSRARRPAVQILALKPFKAAVVAPLLLALSGLMILVSELDNLLRRTAGSPEAFDEAIFSLARGGFAAAVALLIIAPVTEELLFRGLLLSGFARNYGARPAILYSALFFAAIHLNPYQFAGVFAAGLLLGWLRIATGSVWPGVIGHCANNAGIMIIMRVNPDIPGVIHTDAVQFQPLWLDILGVALLGAGIVLFRRMSLRANDANPKGWSA
jgi:membrane protease YdiL (CAAX protease family)